MPVLKRTAVTVLAAAGTASAASHSCKTSSGCSYDDPSYNGPDSGNWEFDVKLRAMRSGGYIYTTATIFGDGPYSSGTNLSFTLNKARFHLQTKTSGRGTDPVVTYANYTGLGHALEQQRRGQRLLQDGDAQVQGGRRQGLQGPIQFTASPTV
ncbi:hypothetical protein ACFWNK_21925 [Streptomyces sp. NPDC058417]|uniref:hypothetical protein n=1 Tax=unclassified Streptomyces TaxID=2593676 RepID=UPI0036598D39